MDRRSFLGLLGGAAAALYVPKRSYFFGPWMPAPNGWATVNPEDVYPVFRDGELVSVTEEWSPGTHRWLLEQVDHGTLSRAAVIEMLGADHPDWRVLSRYDFMSLSDQIVIHRPATADYVALQVEDLTHLGDVRLRQAYTDKVIYAFGRRDKLTADMARAGLNHKQRERVLRRLANKPGPVAQEIREGQRAKFWTPEAA